MGFAEVLTLILVLLKLFAVINVSWFIVFLPMILLYGIAVILWMIIFGLGLIGLRSAKRELKISRKRRAKS